MKKIKNSQPQTKFTGSYKKKSVSELAFGLRLLTRKKHLQMKPQRLLDV